MQDFISSLATFDHESIQADYCVIGSGPAGSVVACELARQGKDVLMLEAGGPLTPAVEDGIGTIDIEGREGLSNRRAAQLGGSSNIWGGLVSALEPSDFAAKGTANGLGWPIAFSDLEAYYGKACRLMDLDWRSLDPSVGRRRFCFGCCDLTAKKFAVSNPPFSMAQYVKAQVAGGSKGRLRVLTDASVVRINVDAGGVVRSVDVLSPGAMTFKAQAKVFILAAGGIETPRLLLLSNDVQQQGIGNRSGLVGRYFSTHPKGELGYLRFNRHLSRRRLDAVSRLVSGAKGYLGAGLSAWHIAEHDQLNHYAQFAPPWHGSLHALVDRFKRRARRQHGFVAAMQPGSGAVRKLRRKSFGFFTALTPRSLTARACVLIGHYDQVPDRDNRITLGEARDARGLRKVDLHWRLSASDRASIIGFFETLRAAFQRSRVGTLDGNIVRGLEQGEFTAFHSHHLGATRMAADEIHGVVDASGRVFSTANLYICGPSVFSTYGFSNPFLTTVALAYRLVDHLTQCS